MLLIRFVLMKTRVILMVAAFLGTAMPIAVWWAMMDSVPTTLPQVTLDRILKLLHRTLLVPLSHPMHRPNS